MHIRILVRRRVALTMPRRDIHRLGRTSHDVIGGQQRCLRNEEDRHAAASTNSAWPGGAFPLANMATTAPKAEWNGPPILVGVIGGSGLYKLEGIEIIDSVRPETVCTYSDAALGLPVVAD